MHVIMSIYQEDFLVSFLDGYLDVIILDVLNGYFLILHEFDFAVIQKTSIGFVFLKQDLGVKIQVGTEMKWPCLQNSILPEKSSRFCST
mmetsp:Transcript_22811/g.29818  ORF Transcript_22811/g.29818 Transcript_22811/m.29818 type:complete len:89 (+) Transcript_22811:114-380(+)